MRSSGLPGGEETIWGDEEVAFVSSPAEKSSHTSNRPIIRLGRRSVITELDGVGDDWTLTGPRGGFDPEQLAGDGARRLVGVATILESIKG